MWNNNEYEVLDSNGKVMGKIALDENDNGKFISSEQYGSWRAEWSGSYPCLCYGEWKLYHDEKVVDTKIPFAEEPAFTYGQHNGWHFDEEFDSCWYVYRDGLRCDEWCDIYSDWLSSIANRSEWKNIFEAFNKNDWRYGECGGCT